MRETGTERVHRAVGEHVLLFSQSCSSDISTCYKLTEVAKNRKKGCVSILNFFYSMA